MIGTELRADPDSVRVIETTRECLDKAIEMIERGRAIEASALAAPAFAAAGYWYYWFRSPV
jgi:hypothetical protein